MLHDRLRARGQGDWAEVVVIEPELEVWVFGDSPHVARILGWEGRQPPFRQALLDNGMWAADALKPTDPKAAMEWALRKAGKPRSSALYRELARRVSFQRCQDRSFRHLAELLQQWFGTDRDADPTL